MQSEINGYAEPQRLRAFLTVLLAFVLDVMDSTIVNVAIPDIQKGLGLTDSAIQWTVAGYFLSFAIFLVAGGRLGDTYGYRRLFTWGIVGFTLASLGCGLASSGEMLIAARALQGAAAAMMSPQVMAVVQLLYTPTERIGRLAFFGMIGGLAAILGPIVGGLLIKADIFGLGWRMIFLVNLPVGVIGIVAGLRYLPAGRPKGTRRIDAVGMALLAAILLLVLFPLIDGRERGWPVWIFALMALALPLGAVFMRHQARFQRRTGDALMAPSLFGERCYTLGLVAVLCFATATGGLFMPLMLTLQRGLGYSPFDAALLHVPFAGGVMVGIVALGRRLLPLWGKYVVVTGSAIMASALLAFSFVLAEPEAPSVPVLLACLLGAGVGMGMIAGPLTPLALARVDVTQAGMASGAFKSAQQVGGALGAAVIGTVFFMVQEQLQSSVSAMSWANLGIVAGLLCTAICALAMPRNPFVIDVDHESPK